MIVEKAHGRRNPHFMGVHITVKALSVRLVRISCEDLATLCAARNFKLRTPLRPQASKSNRPVRESLGEPAFPLRNLFNSDLPILFRNHVRAKN